MFTGRAGAYPLVADAPSGPRSRAALLSAISRGRAPLSEFEERDLFPRLERRGRGSGGAAQEEHVTIRAVAQSIVALLRQSLADGLQPQMAGAENPGA